MKSEQLTAKPPGAPGEPKKKLNCAHFGFTAKNLSVLPVLAVQTIFAQGVKNNEDQLPAMESPSSVSRLRSSTVQRANVSTFQPLPELFLEKTINFFLKNPASIRNNSAGGNSPP